MKSVIVQNTLKRDSFSGYATGFAYHAVLPGRDKSKAELIKFVDAHTDHTDIVRSVASGDECAKIDSSLAIVFLSVWRSSIGTARDNFSGRSERLRSRSNSLATCTRLQAEPANLGS